MSFPPPPPPISGASPISPVMPFSHCVTLSGAVIVFVKEPLVESFYEVPLKLGLFRPNRPQADLSLMSRVGKLKGFSK